MIVAGYFKFTSAVWETAWIDQVYDSPSYCTKTGFWISIYVSSSFVNEISTWFSELLTREKTFVPVDSSWPKSISTDDTIPLIGEVIVNLLYSFNEVWYQIFASLMAFCKLLKVTSLDFFAFSKLFLALSSWISKLEIFSAVLIINLLRFVSACCWFTQ